MRGAIVRAIIVKELTEARRDLRSIVLLALLPALIYPSLLFVVARVGSAGGAKLERTELSVVVDEKVPADLREVVQALPAVTLVEESKAGGLVDARVRIEEGAIDPGRAAIEVVVDRATERGTTAERRIVPALEDARLRARDARLRALGVDDEAIAVAPVAVIDTAPPARKGGFLLSRAIVPILVLMILMGAYYPAVETTVGERERHTLRTLLCAPVDATAIALGKLAVVALLAFVAGMANLTGLVVTARLGLLEQSGFVIPMSAIALIALLLVPLAILLAAVLMATASLARTSREAQTLLTPLTLVVTIPAIAPSFPGIEPTVEKALIPIFGIALTIREILGGTATPALVVAALIGAALFIAAALVVAARAFTVEALLTGKVAMPLRGDGPLELFDAALLVLGMAATLVLSGSLLTSMDPIASVVVVQLATFLCVPLAFVFVRSRSPRRALGLVAPAHGSLLLVVGALICLPTLGAIGARFARETIDPSELEPWAGLAERMMELPPVVLLVVFAVLPAVVEEIAFRGALQRALTRHAGFHAVWVSALVFSLFHGSFARTLPTFLVGALAGAVAYRAGSTLPAMLVHVAHNGFALALGLTLVDDVSETFTGSPYDALPLAVHVLVIPGALLLALAFRRAGRAPSSSS